MEPELVNIVSYFSYGKEVDLFRAALILKSLIDHDNSSFFTSVKYARDFSDETVSAHKPAVETVGKSSTGKKASGKQFKNQMEIRVANGGAIKLFSNGTFHFTGFRSPSLEETMRQMINAAWTIIQLVVTDTSYYYVDEKDLVISSTIYQIQTGIVLPKETAIYNFIAFEEAFNRMQLITHIEPTNFTVNLYYSDSSNVFYCDCGLNYICGIRRTTGRKEQFDCKKISILIYRTGLLKIYGMNSINCIERVLSFVKSSIIPVMMSNV